MGRMIGYMVTWRTYGTWVADECAGRNEYGRLVRAAVSLTEKQQAVVKEALLGEVWRQKETLEALAVDSSHVHMVLRTTRRTIPKFVAVCKTVARQALQASGFGGKVWARGYDKRFCFDEGAIRDRAAYVQRHEGGNGAQGDRRGTGGENC